jgi:hypothetical protein
MLVSVVIAAKSFQSAGNSAYRRIKFVATFDACYTTGETNMVES